MRRTAVVALTALTALTTLGAPGRAHAAAVAATGATQLVAAPASTARGALESDTAVRVFTEQSVTLSVALTVWTVSSSGGISQTSWEAGACLQSHLVHADAVGTATPTFTGAIGFTQPIVGVIPVNDPLTRALDRTDGPTGTFPFGVTGTTYPAAADTARGLELISLTPDQLAVPNATTLNYTLRGDGFDQLRVLTTCGPAPVIPEVPLRMLLPLSAAALLGGRFVLDRRRPQPS